MKEGEPMNNQLKVRLNHFLEEMGVPVTQVCRRVNLSPQSLYDWRKDKLKLADSTLKRIGDYLAKYNF